MNIDLNAKVKDTIKGQELSELDLVVQKLIDEAKQETAASGNASLSDAINAILAISESVRLPEMDLKARISSAEQLARLYKTSKEYMNMAKAYQSAGLPQQAAEILDKAMSLKSIFSSGMTAYSNVFKSGTGGVRGDKETLAGILDMRYPEKSGAMYQQSGYIMQSLAPLFALKQEQETKTAAYSPLDIFKVLTPFKDLMDKKTKKDFQDYLSSFVTYLTNPSQGTTSDQSFVQALNSYWNNK